MSLASLRGKVVLLTFLDPVCTTDCPLIAQEFRAAGQLLGPASRKVELVAVVANPVYHQVTDTQAFDRAEQLNQVPNWRYLTGSVPQLQQVWKDYGVSPAEILPAGVMIGHQDIAYVIDQAGHVRAGNSASIRARRPPPPSPRSRSCSPTPPGKCWGRHEPPQAGVAAARCHDANRRLRARSQHGPASQQRRTRRPWLPHWSPPRVPGRSRSWAGRQPSTTTSGSCSSAPPQPANGSWPPRPGWPATAAWWWPAGAVGGGRVPAQPGAVVLPRSPPAMTTALAGRQGCSTPPWPMSPTPWPPLPAAPTCSRCSQAAAPSCPGPAGPAGRDWLPARPSPPPPRAASAAGAPHRRSVQPSRGSPAGSQLHPPRDSRHLRPHQRDVATGRARAPRDVRTPGHHRPSAHHHGRHHHGAAGGRQRIGGTTADRMVHGRQRPLGFVAAAAPARRETYLGIVRARRRLAVVLTGNHAQAITGPAGAWRPLPPLPPGTATLAPEPAGGLDALAVHSTRLSIWQLPPGHTAWTATQTISVFIQFGSSG